MSTHHAYQGSIVKRGEATLLIGAAIVGIVFSMSLSAPSQKQAFVSSEVLFTDSSASGLAIVPASCPSVPHYVGECSGGGIVIPPPPPPAVSFTSFVSTAVAASGDSGGAGSPGVGAGVALSGHLQLSPPLIRQGNTTRIYWNVANAAACTVTGDNGDIFTGNSSGTSGTPSSPIVGRTTYILFCTALAGASPATVEETAVVNVVPTFQEI